MLSIQELSKKQSAFSGGHRMCAGCGVPIFTRMLTQVTDYEIVVINATGCLEVASTIFPYSAWRVPWVHTAFENASSTASGVEAMYRCLAKQGKAKKKTKFVVIGGDGGSYDIGLQSLSGAMERGHDLLYICYDNGAYMNTGIQRSSATPLGAATTTTPAGELIPGRTGRRKDLTKVMVAHNIGYAAQASIHNPVDLSNKIKKGIEHDGPAFLNIFTPCVPGWKIDANQTVELARLGVETRFWNLYEVENGIYKVNYKPKENKPVTDWIFIQGRFAHLKSPKWKYVLDEFQAEVNRQWIWLLEEAGNH